MRASLCLLAGLAWAAAVPGARAYDLYEDSVIVTGTGAGARSGAMRHVLRQVLAKASGNPAWLMDERADGVPPEALVQGFVYLDRQSDLPKHDEQGTRDRPYYLVVRFDPAGVDAALRRWGDAPWPEPRPPLPVSVTIVPRDSAPVPMRADTDPDERHRAALLDAARRFGLPLVLRPADAPPQGPEGTVLTGRVAWSAADFGWNAEWTMTVSGVTRRWGTVGTSFDAAYRNGAAGAAALLSGHEAPRDAR